MMEPKELGLAIARRSARLAHDVSQGELKVFGKTLMEPGVDLSKHQNEPNYQDFLTRPDRIRERAVMEQHTCVALADAVLGSERLIRWALEPLLPKIQD